MRKRSPAESGAGNASQTGNLHRHSTATRKVDTARPRVGEVVNVPGIGRCHVVGDSDPSLLTVQTPQGTEFRVGERGITRLEVGQ